MVKNATIESIVIGHEIQGFVWGLGGPNPTRIKTGLGQTMAPKVGSKGSQKAYLIPFNMDFP